jgi:CubicO group peptidase (beta-lactamase class C family)
MKRRDFLVGTVAAPSLAAVLWDAPPSSPSAGHVRKRPTARRQQADERLESIARLVTERMTALGITGVALGVVKDGRTTLRGFGVANVESPEQRVTADTVFSLASLSKTVAATAVMRLVEQGKLRLDAPVQTYLPDFRVLDPEASRTVTIRHLLTHTPGWEGQLTVADNGLSSFQVFADSMKDLPQLAPPGAVWSYNNAGFSLAGRVIEVVTGSDIHTALRDLVFQPLELTRSSTRMGEVVTWPFAQGHRPSAAGSVEVVRPFALQQRHGRRRRHEHLRSHELRALPPGRDGNVAGGRAVTRIAGRDEAAAAPQEFDSR